MTFIKSFSKKKNNVPKTEKRNPSSFKKKISKIKNTISQSDSSEFNDIYGLIQGITTTKYIISEKIPHIPSIKKLPNFIFIKILIFLKPFDICLISLINKKYSKISLSKNVWDNIYKNIVKRKEKFSKNNTNWRKIKNFWLYSRFVYPPKTILNAHKGAIIKIIEFSLIKRKVLISIGEDREIKIWNLESFKVERFMKILNPKEILYDVFQFNNKILITVTKIIGKQFSRHNIRLWNLRERKCVAICEGHYSLILYLGVMKHGKEKFLVSGSLDSTIRVWDQGFCQKILKEDYSLESDKDIFIGFCKIDNNRLIVTTAKKKIQIWDLKKGNFIILGETSSRVGSMLKLPSNRIAFACHGKIEIWNYYHKMLEKVFRHGTKKINSLCKIFNHQFASCSEDNFIRVWNLERGCVNILEYTTPINGIKQMMNGRLLSYSNNKIQIWNVMTEGICEKEMKESENNLASVIELCDGKIASCAYDKTIRIFDWDLDKNWKGSWVIT